ncbi:nucleotide-binding protein [Flavobacterium piscinae]|uniref:STING domain-containing protein n=1 Tax=Flavobacterium piscinae TaxID=2506424 RepID=UPI0019A3777B|nr:STING domain-containing protein [Flavobacterium piscinae]MBC8884276.1 nucleotide-binding protein [Flavobacterium piscinae]
MDFTPNIFIGSSKEGKKVAEEIINLLKGFADCTLWTKAFQLGKSNFENLEGQIAFYDYAILIATADDVTISRKIKQKTVRDNVLFEFGLFTGGLGPTRVFYIVEEETKIPSDLYGITLPFIPKIGNPNFNEVITKQVFEIKKHIENKEKTFDLGFLPSTALAYGYFNNFVEKTVKRLLEDKADSKVFNLKNGSQFKIIDLKFTILIPNDLSDDMFNKVIAKRLKGGWQKLKVEPKDVRDYDFSVDVSKAEKNLLHLVDIPLTLNALNMSIEIYSKKQHLGKSVKEEVLEVHEIRNFKRTLEYLIKKVQLQGILLI